MKMKIPIRHPWPCMVSSRHSLMEYWWQCSHLAIVSLSLFTYFCLKRSKQKPHSWSCILRSQTLAAPLDLRPHTALVIVLHLPLVKHVRGEVFWATSCISRLGPSGCHWSWVLLKNRLSFFLQLPRSYESQPDYPKSLSLSLSSFFFLLSPRPWTESEWVYTHVPFYTLKSLRHFL
jgi:hypothetical protein